MKCLFKVPDEYGYEWCLKYDTLCRVACLKCADCEEN